MLVLVIFCVVCFFEQTTAYAVRLSLVGEEMFIKDKELRGWCEGSEWCV